MQVPHQDGNKFRDDVAALLSAKFRDVTKEFALTGKKADIFFSEPLFPIGQRKIAVECKAWKKPLTSKLISAIRSEYDPAFVSNEIDSLWIVTTHDIEALPKRSAAPYGPNLQVFTFTDLQNSMMNFDDYLMHLIKSFDDNGLSSYYMETFTDDRQNLHEDVVVPWLCSSTTATPLAVFGGYGIGKSSYAKRLASWLADRALKDRQRRIPILVRLGGLTQAQNIRDLLTVQFAADHRVDGFNYNLFAQLNALGRFVLIFDGFDEMKHAMRKRDIEINFRNICQLIFPMSKLIIFGRPDPFLTIEDELFLRGKNALANKVIFDDPNRLEFELHTISMFDESSAYEFMRKYISWNSANNAHGIKYEPSFVMSRMRELQNLGASELIRRPVHAQILADLALIPGQNIQIQNEYDLYYEFLFRIAKRETTEKDARQSIDADLRIGFMLEIAWWLWSKKQVNSFSIDEIPADVVNATAKYFPEAVDRETTLREMLIGSVLERSQMSKIFETKDEIKFFFPHRSYWEFLTAEYISLLRFVAMDIGVISETLTERVVRFIRERPDRVFMTQIARYSLTLTPRLPITFVARLSEMKNQSDIENAHQALRKGEIAVTPVDLTTHILACCRNSERNWNMIDEYVDTLLLRGNTQFDCVFLATLAWSTTNDTVSLRNRFVMKTWKKICCMSVLRAHETWCDALSDHERKWWEDKGEMPHTSAYFRLISHWRPKTVRSKYYAAEVLFGKTLLFKRRRLLGAVNLIKFNLGFVANSVGAAVKEILSFGPDQYGGYLVDVDVEELSDDIASSDDQIKLQKLVSHGKWDIDLGI
jgi:hypothetical protein